jgi:hypothetical protein
MALPASLSTVTVAGTYVDLVGNPVRGSITFEPQTILKEKAAECIIMPVHNCKNFRCNRFFYDYLASHKRYRCHASTIYLHP